MSLTADVYNAVLGDNQPAEQFTAFNVDPGGPPDAPLRYRFGAIAADSAALSETGGRSTSHVY